MIRPAWTVVPLPLSVVESNIWDVTTWPAFLGGVEWVERTAHELYVFGVREGRRLHEIPVAVRWSAHDHRVGWQELAGPPWRGELQLTAVNGRRTRVELFACTHPRSVFASLASRFGHRVGDLQDDLTRLADRLSSIPQPFNPARLTPTRQLRRRAPEASASAPAEPVPAEPAPPR